MTDLRQEMNASIECNNIGVSLLKAGLLGESLETFEAAAQLMHTISQSFNKPYLTERPTPAVASPEPASSQLIQHRLDILLLWLAILPGKSVMSLRYGLQPGLLNWTRLSFSPYCYECFEQCRPDPPLPVELCHLPNIYGRLVELHPLPSINLG
jgi:hypothetical protein